MITLRTVKGSPLTHGEMDANFTGIVGMIDDLEQSLNPDGTILQTVVKSIIPLGTVAGQIPFVNTGVDNFEYSSSLVWDSNAGNLDVNGNITISNLGSLQLNNSSQVTRGWIGATDNGLGQITLVVSTSFNESISFRHGGINGDDLLTIQGTTGNLGVGTISPTARLDIIGSTNTEATATALFRNSDGDQLLKVLDDGTSHLVKLRIVPIENSPNTSYPKSNLIVQGKGDVNCASATFTYGNDSLGEVSMTAHRGTWKTLYVRDGALSTHNAYFTGTKPIIFDAGNVGINTITPTAQFEIHASTTSITAQIVKSYPGTYNANLSEWYDETDTLSSYIGAKGNYTVDGVGAGQGFRLLRNDVEATFVTNGNWAQIGTGSNDDFAIITNSTEVVRFGNNGFVSIGSSIHNEAKFSVYSDGDTSSTANTMLKNINGDELFKILDDGRAEFGGKASNNSENVIQVGFPNASATRGIIIGNLNGYGITSISHSYTPSVVTSKFGNQVSTQVALISGANNRIEFNLAGDRKMYLDGDSVKIGEITGVTARLQIGRSTLAAAHVHLQAGVDPTTPNDGDIWFNGTNLKMQIGGVTKTFVMV
jgi:hypothetical protein